jgi:hypothetical protein
MFHKNPGSPREPGCKIRHQVPQHHLRYRTWVRSRSITGKLIHSKKAIDLGSHQICHEPTIEVPNHEIKKCHYPSLTLSGSEYSEVWCSPWMCVRRVVTPCLAEPGAWEHARARHERELTSAAAAAADEEAGGETSLDPTWWMPPTSCLPVRCPPRDRAARHGNAMCREEGVAGRGNKLRAREEVRTGKERRGRNDGEGAVRGRNIGSGRRRIETTGFSPSRFSSFLGVSVQESTPFRDVETVSPFSPLSLHYYTCHISKTLSCQGNKWG